MTRSVHTPSGHKALPYFQEDPNRPFNRNQLAFYFRALREAGSKITRGFHAGNRAYRFNYFTQPETIVVIPALTKSERNF